MSSNRMKLLLLSVMAVVAVSAVASASASAAATCYPVAAAGAGNYSSSVKCEKREPSTPAEWIAIEKLETEIKPGEWCAKVKAGEPSRFEDNKCTKAKTSTGEFTKVKVSVDEWEVQKCEEGTATVKFTTNSCEVESATGKFTETGPLEKLAAGKKRKVVSEGKTGFKLTAGTLTITCKEVTDKGTITGGKPGTDLAEEIKFTGCTTGQAGCKVRSKGGTFGTVAVTNIPTKLEQRVIGEEEILVDNFEQKEIEPGKFEFVTLQFEPESGKSCSEYPETKVKGTIAAEVVPGTGRT